MTNLMKSEAMSEMKILRAGCRHVRSVRSDVAGFVYPKCYTLWERKHVHMYVCMYM